MSHPQKYTPALNPSRYARCFYICLTPREATLLISTQFIYSDSIIPSPSADCHTRIPRPPHNPHHTRRTIRTAAAERQENSRKGLPSSGNETAPRTDSDHIARKKESRQGRPFVFFPYLCTRKCACGGTGRRARLRIWFLAKCRFESCQAHTQKLRNAGHRTNRTSPGPHDVS